MVPYGYSVRIFSDENGHEPIHTYEGQQDSNGFMTCHTWNCETGKCPKALRVYRSEHLAAVGRWEKVGQADEAMEFTFMQGLTSSTGKKTNHED